MLSLFVVGVAYERILNFALSHYLGEALNAEVAINGPLNFSIGDISTLSAEQISIRTINKAFRAKQVEISFNSQSLYHRPVHVTALTITQGDLEIRSTVEAQKFTLDTQALLDYLNARLPDFERVLIPIDHVEVLDSQFSYVDADQNIDLKLNIANLTRSSLGRLGLSIQGLLNQAELTMTAELVRKSPLTNLHLAGQWGEYKLAVDGHVEKITPLQNLDIVLDANGPSARLLLDLIGAEEVRDGQFSIVTHLHDLDGKFSWFAHLSLGELMLHGQLTHSLADKDFRLDFNGAGPSLKEAGALVDYLNYSELPFITSGVLTRIGNRLTLEESQIQLGEGYFKASGALPNFPALDDWQLNISAKQFDLTILQPFSPCEIPNLPMDWTGNFSSAETGPEIFSLELSGPTQVLNVSGELGKYPDFIGSIIEIKSKGLDLNTLTGCVGLPAFEPSTFETSLSLKNLESGWQIQDWTLNSVLLNAESNLLFNTDGTILGHTSISTNNLKTLTTTFGFDSGLTETPGGIDVDLGLHGQRLTLSNGKLSSQTGKGTFSGHYEIGTAEPSMGLNLDVAGTDIQSLLINAPKLLAGKPFSAKSKILTNEAGRVSMDTTIALGDNRIRARGTFPQGNSLEGLSLNLEGQGSNLEHFLGSVVAYPLPATPFDVTFGLVHRGDTIEIAELLLEAGNQKLSGNLLVDLAPNLSGTRGQLKLEGNSSQTLFQLMGFNPDFIDEAYSLGVDIEGNLDSVSLTIDNATLGLSDVSGKILIKPGDTDQFDVELTSRRLHLPTFIPALISATDDKKDPIVVKDRVIPDFDLPWRYLSDIKLNFIHKAAKVDLQLDNHSSTELAFAIDDGRLHSQNISWQSDKSDGTAVLVIDQSPEDKTNADIRFEISSERIPLLWLFTGTPVDVDGERLQFNARFNSKGHSSAEVLKNLNGLVAFRGGGGVINTSKLDTLFGDFLLQLTRRVFSTAEKQTNVHCTGSAFSITNGKILFDPVLAVRTSRFDILATGEINLPNEALKLQINSRSRQGIGVSAVSSLVPRVGVVGTLAKPQVQVSATETAISSGAAIASSGLSILASGLWDRLRSSVENPCDAVYDRALKDSKAQYGQMVNGHSG